MKKEIENYKGYEVDEKGNVYSKPKKGNGYTYKKLVQRNNRDGYKRVTIYNDLGQMCTVLVHRIVAQSFLENHNNFRNVNHIDGNKENNEVSNLEWCTTKHNTRHAYKNNLGNFKDRVQKNLENIFEKQGIKKVTLIKGDVVLYFQSTNEASLFLNTHRDNISRAYRKNQKCKGYTVICEKNC